MREADSETNVSIFPYWFIGQVMAMRRTISEIGLATCEQQMLVSLSVFQARGRRIKLWASESETVLARPLICYIADFFRERLRIVKPKDKLDRQKIWGLTYFG